MKKLFTLVSIALISLCSVGQGLDNAFYFRVGYSSPSWNQFGGSKEEWNAGGNATKTGGVFEVGSIFMLNRLLVADNMAIGINIDYLYLNANVFSNGKDHVGHSRLGSKIGPSFTYIPGNKMAIDVYAKADVAWVSAAVEYEDKISDADDYSRGKVAYGFSTGLNFRYGILMLGLEYDTISPELESDDNPGEFYGQVGDLNSKKSPLPCMNFTIGLSF